MNKTEPIDASLVNYCPFCDHFKSQHSQWANPILANNGKKRGFAIWVECGLCRAAGPISHDKEGAISLWNERGMEGERINACRLFAQAIDGISAAAKTYKEIPMTESPVGLEDLLTRHLDD
jgi:hypothetical protein